MPSRHILVLNSGSSSIKFSLWETAADARGKLLEGEVEGIGVEGESSASFWVKSWMNDSNGVRLVDEKSQVNDIAKAFARITKALQDLHLPQHAAIGHRMVSAGPTITANQRLTPELIDEMEQYTAFAPLHAPSEIFLMREAMKMYPAVPNFMCLDNWFHRDLPEVARSLPIPAEYSAKGVRRYGAHGLSYESIVAHLHPNVPERLIVAHLGNGASICAVHNGRSVDTSMGLTPTGGIISGSRTGDLDPGVLIFLLRDLTKRDLANEQTNTGNAADVLERIANKHSGLAGVSELSNDMRTLREAIAAGNTKARLAVDQFTYAIRRFIGAYIAVLGGLDMLVFTGGIGENDSATRTEVCAGLEGLGIVLDPERNQSRGEATISADGSRVLVQVISPAEDLMIVNHICRLLTDSGS